MVGIATDVHLANLDITLTLGWIGGIATIQGWIGHVRIWRQALTMEQTRFVCEWDVEIRELYLHILFLQRAPEARVAVSSDDGYNSA